MSNRYWLITTTGERFPLTKAQLMSDPGNSLAAKFIGDDKSQSTIGELVVDEETALVKLIHAHLRGYEVLPLLDGVIPYLSKEATLRTFLSVARQFRLYKLQEKVERSLGKQYPSRRVLWSLTYETMMEVTEGGCDALLKRVISGSSSVYVPTKIPEGYRVIISWAQPMMGEAKHEWFVLLESTDYEKGGGLFSTA